MCGLTGFWDKRANLSKDALLTLAKKMSDQMVARGPDSYGLWCDENLGLALGHRRLSIVELTDHGHQPMISSSGRMIISYNGEIYNAPEIRTELKKLNKNLHFRGNSDTEVILEACDLLGVEATCKRLIGMFAFSIWDKEQKKLFLARDRIGIKPLYWGYSNKVLFFGSQLKSFIPHPQWRAEIDMQALHTYFMYNYIPYPLSIFKGIYKLKPGSITVFNVHGNHENFSYWSLEKCVVEGLSHHASIKNQCEKTILTEFEMLLKDSVKRRMVADVPLGAFLSGGIDSSTIVALMQAQSNRTIKTFSIGYKEDNYNEAKYSAAIAKYLKTEHHELILDDSTALNFIPEIPNWFDEPFADASQIPTYFVSQLARKHVIVSLSGDGGDELFTGYERYWKGQQIWRRLNYFPEWLKKLAAKLILKGSPEQWNQISNIYSIRNKPGTHLVPLGEKLHQIARILNVSSSTEFYRLLVSKWENPELLLANSNTLNSPLIDNFTNPVELESTQHFIDKMQFIDLSCYLPDDILAKVDRASMAVSLEARVPLLDHRVVEFSWKIPQTMKYRNGQSKWLLRQVLYQYIPENLFNRPKMGFNIPIDAWLRGPLKEWAENLLDPSKLETQGILNPKPITKRWQELLACKRYWNYSLNLKNSHYPLWSILMFQAWKEYWKI